MTDHSAPPTSIDDLLSRPGTARTDAPHRGPGPDGEDSDTGGWPNELDPDFHTTPRSRPRLTRFTAALALLTAAAAGFAGGLQAPRLSESGGSQIAAGGPAPGPGPAGVGSAPGRFSLPGGASSSAGGLITGTIKAVHGSVIYLTDAQGRTITIRVSRSTIITKTIAVKLAALARGERLTIRGTKAADGSYQAASVSAGASASGEFPLPAGHP